MPDDEKDKLEYSDFIDLKEDDLEQETAMTAYFDEAINQGTDRKLDRNTYNTIIKYVSMGSYITNAAAAAGVSYSSLRRWMLMGEQDPDSIYGQFNNDLQKALGKAQLRSELIIQKAMPNDWKAAAWWLGKVRPDVYGKESKLKVEVSSDTGLPVLFTSAKEETMFIDSDELRKMLDYEAYVNEVNKLPAPEDNVEDAEFSEVDERDDTEGEEP